MEGLPNIMQIATGFMGSKVLFTAMQVQLFELLEDFPALTSKEIHTKL